MMKNHIKRFYVFGLIFIAVGCAKNELSSTIEDVNQGILNKFEQPYCEMDPTDYVLAPKIQSYSITAQNKAHAPVIRPS